MTLIFPFKLIDCYATSFGALTRIYSIKQGKYEVWSMNTKDKKEYAVSCGCQGFLMTDNCKHVKKIIEFEKVMFK